MSTILYFTSENNDALITSFDLANTLSVDIIQIILILDPHFYLLYQLQLHK